MRLIAQFTAAEPLIELQLLRVHFVRSLGEHLCAVSASNLDFVASPSSARNRAVGQHPRCLEYRDCLHWRFAKETGITKGFRNKMETISRQAYGSRNFETYRVRVKVLRG